MHDESDILKSHRACGKQIKRNAWQHKSHNTVFFKRMVSLITSVLRGKLPHCSRQTLVELVFAGNEGLADGLLPESQHATMPPHLVYEGLKHHPLLHVALLVLQLMFLHLLCIRGLLCLSLYSRTHPPLAPTTLRWALASSLTHTQCGGGTMWQGHAHTQSHTADPQKPGRGISN